MKCSCAAELSFSSEARHRAVTDWRALTVSKLSEQLAHFGVVVEAEDEADGVVVKRTGKDASGGWLLSVHPAWEPAPWPADTLRWSAR